MALLMLEDVGKIYPDGTVAVRDLSLAVGDGELLVLVGPSGCGKMTALRMVAGLEDISSGVISLDGRVINDVEERERDIAMVFQSYALYPHMSVFDNIAFPLKLARVPKSERTARVRAVAATLQLERYLDQKPAQLSGGQRQRVAMGRAIVREPSVFLMDEPLSNLDAKLRIQMRGEILELQRRLGTTTMYVTHDQFEAMTLGDRVAVLRGGELQQVGTPKEIYDAPANLFVAGFLGSPPMNLIEAEVFVSEDSLGFRLGAREVEIDEEERRRQPQIRDYVGRTVVVGMRPERLGLEPNGASTRRQVSGVLRLGEVLGSDLFGHFLVDGARPLSAKARARAHDVEDPTQLQDLSGAEIGTTVVGRFSPDVALDVGDLIDVSLRPASLRFFDPDSGLAI